MCTPKKTPSQSMSLITRQHVPFDKEVLLFLLEHQAQITNPVVRDFVNRYVRWLYRLAAQDSAAGEGGVKHLCRWETNGASYGYYPADVSYWLSKLNQQFFVLMGNAYIRATRQPLDEELPPLNTLLSLEILSGLSAPLGFFVLVRHLQTDAFNQDKAWLERACDLFGDLGDLETWRPRYDMVMPSVTVKQHINSPVSEDEPYYNTSKPGSVSDNLKYKKPSDIPKPPPAASDIQGKQYEEGFKVGYQIAHHQVWQQNTNDIIVRSSRAYTIIEAERKRLVDFLKSLRQTLDILNEDPLLVADQWEEVPAQPHPGSNGHNSDGV